MNSPAKYRLTDLQLLLLLAAGRFVIHLLANNQYGFTITFKK